MGLVVDASRPDDVRRLFDVAFTKRDEMSPPEAIVFNAGNNRHIPFLDLTSEEMGGFWRGGCYAGFLVGQAAARHLLPLGRGTVVFTGASGSLRGKPGFAHFSASKAGLRMVAQAMAREFGPRGIHVAHAVVDGGVNGERLRVARPDRVEHLGEDGMLDIDAVAEAYCDPPATSHGLDAGVGP